MRHPPELGVKQFVAVVRGRFGKYAVFTTGSDRHYLFSCVTADGVFTGLSFPVLKKDLRRDIASALRHGWGNASLVDEPGDKSRAALSPRSLSRPARR
jgi:hypothetical protein